LFLFMHLLLTKEEEKFKQAISHLQDDLSTLRIGRANPLIVENIIVEAYGAKTPVKQLASIAVPEARTLIIQPWDKSITADIEKAILGANIGINPVNEGQQIRLTVPQLTEESRKILSKAVAEKQEKSRIALRQLREKIKEEVIAKQKTKEVTEDIKFDVLKDLDELIKNYNDQIKDLGDKKINEIMTI